MEKSAFESASVNNRNIVGHRDQLPRSVKRMLVGHDDNVDNDQRQCDTNDASMTKSRKHYYLFRHAPNGQPNTNLLILLHGAGDTHIPYDKLAQRMELPQTATLAISARRYQPLVYNLEQHCENYYTWFDREGNEEDGGDEPLESSSGSKQQQQQRRQPRQGLSLQNAARKLTKVLQQLIVTEQWIIPERVFLFGYGDGATLAMQVCECWAHENPSFASQIDEHHPVSTGGGRGQQQQPLQSVSPLGGAICVAGGSSNTTKENVVHSDQRHQQRQSFVQRPIKTPILLVVGEHDESFPPEQATKIQALYGKASVEVYIAPNKGQGMIQSESEMYKVMEFLSQRLVRISTNMMMVQPPATTSKRYNNKK